jgi:peptide/nickel transport system permease protein
MPPAIPHPPQDPIAVPPPPSAWRRAWDSDIAYSFRTSPCRADLRHRGADHHPGRRLRALLAPYNPYDPGSLNLMDGFTPPMEPNAFTGNVYWLGTDNQGRDVFSTILYGARISLFVGFAAVIFAMVLGITLGLIAGYRGGWVDSLLMRIADVQLTFPSILLALLIFGIARGFIPPAYRETMAIWVLIVAIGLSDWVQYARVVRGATMVEKGKEYVQAARVIGRHPASILVRHILPNVMGPVLVIATIGLALAIIAEATLSFLGVGVPPTQPSARHADPHRPGLPVLRRVVDPRLPLRALLALALSVNLLGDWLRDALNPRLR